MKNVIIEIDNLKCGGCAATISNSLSQFDGVEKVEVNNETSEVTLSYEEELDFDEIKKKLEFLGYPEKGTTNKFQTAKSYVSCAIGKVTK